LEIELEQVALETRRVQVQFTEELENQNRRWTELIRERKLQIEKWDSSRPHDDELEYRFLERREENMLINEEFREWLRQYKMTQSEVNGELSSPTDSELSTKLSDVWRMKIALERNLDIEIPRLKDILNRFEESVLELGSFNSTL
jgi:hypothetical protein